MDFLGTGNLQNSHNTFKGIVFRDKERVCVPITSSYPGYQRPFSRVGLETFVGRRPTDLRPFFSPAEQALRPKPCFQAGHRNLVVLCCHVGCEAVKINSVRASSPYGYCETSLLPRFARLTIFCCNFPIFFFW